MIEFDEIGAEMTMTCDHCGNSLTVEGEFWGDCIEKCKTRGWQIRPSSVHTGNFFHYCFQCQFQV